MKLNIDRAFEFKKLSSDPKIYCAYCSSTANVEKVRRKKNFSHASDIQNFFKFVNPDKDNLETVRKKMFVSLDEIETVCVHKTLLYVCDSCLSMLLFIFQYTGKWLNGDEVY